MKYFSTDRCKSKIWYLGVSKVLILERLPSTYISRNIFFSNLLVLVLSEISIDRNGMFGSHFEAVHYKETDAKYVS